MFNCQYCGKPTNFVYNTPKGMTPVCRSQQCYVDHWLWELKSVNTERLSALITYLDKLIYLSNREKGNSYKNDIDAVRREIEKELSITVPAKEVKPQKEKKDKKNKKGDKK